MTTQTSATTDREEWLTTAAQLIQDELIAPYMPDGQPQTIPFRVSVGFPPRSRATSKVIAVCCVSRASADNHSEIFVTPQLSDSLEILAALTHEMIHQSDDCQSGHRNHFARVARKVGLEGPLTATTPGQALTTYLHTIIDALGQIPHAALDLSVAKKKQTTRMIKVECSQLDCAFSFRTSKTQLEKLNFNECYCPACNQNSLKTV